MHKEDVQDKKTLLDTISGQISVLKPVLYKLLLLPSIQDKLSFLTSFESVRTFLFSHEKIKELSPEKQYVVLSLVILEQSEMVYDNLLDNLFEIESLYKYMGGIIGYHIKTLELIAKTLEDKEKTDIQIEAVPYVDIRRLSNEVEENIIAGIESLESFAEVYVVGGAGDRLGLTDEKTHTALPVACLQFCGRSLLETLVRDLQAREFLYYKHTGRQITTPIVLMTSLEKDNDYQIQKILEEANYFGRPKESICRILQPLVPVLTISGNWAISPQFGPVMKPGGHGVIWLLAENSGAFDWLRKLGRKYLLIRQINNPIAGLDYGLLALAGYGVSHNKAFGFLSCPRKMGMSEGMNVLYKDGVTHGSISNIEYTEFTSIQKKRPEILTEDQNCDFPTNTNILFASISDISKAIKKCPIPGLLVNMKHPVEILEKGEVVRVPGARLESTMQNIADALTDEINDLQTFLLLNERAKTMSVTKNANGLVESPESAFSDLREENLRLLKTQCQFTVSPSALFLYHPALGPLYSIIKQKIHSGVLLDGAELQIEAQDVQIRDLVIDGSLLIDAAFVTGKIDPVTNLCTFGPEVGGIVFTRVRIKNEGIDKTAPSCFWKNSIIRKESCRIILEGYSQCIATDVTIEGDIEIRVKDNERVRISESLEGKLVLTRENIRGP